MAWDVRRLNWWKNAIKIFLVIGECEILFLSYEMVTIVIRKKNVSWILISCRLFKIVEFLKGPSGGGKGKWDDWVVVVVTEGGAIEWR